MTRAESNTAVPLHGVPAPMLVLAGIASVQTGSAIARTIFDDLGVTGTALWRLTLAAGLLLIVLRPKLRTWKMHSWRAAAMLAAALAGMNVTFYLSLSTVPLGVAVTVEFLGPLLLALAQTRRLVDVCWSLVAGGGVALLGIDTTSGIPLGGLLLAFVAGLFWAGYILASAHVGQVLPGVDGLAVALAIAALIVLPFGIAGGKAAFGEPRLLIPAAAVALLSSVIAYGLELTALRRLPTRIFGILMSLQPAAAAIAGLVLLSQQLGRKELLALLLVTCASVGITVNRREGLPATQPVE